MLTQLVRPFIYVQYVICTYITDTSRGAMTENTERFEMRVTKAFLKVVDEWRRKQPDLPSRAEAIRRLVENGATGGAKKRPAK